MATPPHSVGLGREPIGESPLRASVSATDSPASFKKRAVNRGGIVGRVSSWARRQPPSHISLPSNPFASEDGTSTPAGGSRSRLGSVLSPMSNETMRRLKSPMTEDPPTIPAAYPSVSTPEHSNPLPTIPMFVLSICMIGEFISASTPAAFMFFMVEAFLTGPNGKPDESAVGLWTGNLSATYFLAQFLTSLLWASAAEKHGRRAVLFVALLGNAIALSVFGASTSLGMAFCARAAQGLFNGAVGVARGAVRDIADPTNEARAYSIVGLAWGLGGIIGPILGGLFEHPVTRYPGIFGGNELFAAHPYLFPCMLSSSIPLFGALLCVFLGPNGGPRTGGIRLPEEKDKDVERSGNTTMDASTVVPGSSTALRRGSAVSYGTAYGYERSIRQRHFSRASNRNSVYADQAEPPDSSNLNFAQRLLLANEDNVFSITDLWVQAATREDEDAISMADYDGNSVFDEDEESRMPSDDEGGDMFGYEASEADNSMISRRDLRSKASKTSLGVPKPRPLSQFGPGSSRISTAGFRDRLQSVASQRAVPAIYGNLGLSSEPAILPVATMPPDLTPMTPPAGLTETPNMNSLAPIPEGRTANAVSPSEPFPPTSAAVVPESLFKQLPLALIVQYACLALHGTCMDQVFMSFLVTKAESGGLGLNPGNYAELVAAMFHAQFNLYPQGKLSHVSMFRLGLLCYLPVYLLFPFLRVLLMERSILPVFLGMVMLSALRYVSNTFAYTSVAILVNAMTPPHLLSFSNGLAQSAASAARFCGPVIGGLLWSFSIREGLAERTWPSNEAFGFIVTACICATGLITSFWVRRLIGKVADVRQVL